MAIKKRGLGRGLDALLGEVAATVENKDHGLKVLPIEFLRRGKFQPRQDMNLESLQELAASIEAQGIIQPIIVRFVSIDEYEIVAGERRWRAAQIAQLQEVPVVIKDIDDRSVMAVALIENIQREDLNALEESEALKRLVDDFDLTHQQVAYAVGKSRAMVSNLLRLIDLQADVKALLSKGLLEMGHARALLALDAKQQLEIANKVVKQALTVRATEKIIKNLGLEKKTGSAVKDSDTLRLQSDLTEKIGAKVSINHQNSGKGRLVISYTSLEELEGIIERIN